MTPHTYTEIAARLAGEQIGVIPTDTIYGLVALARSEVAVERIYDVKNRDRRKPLVVLVADYDQLGDLGVSLRRQTLRSLAGVWPGPASVILPCAETCFGHLHRGTAYLAVRMPDDSKLRGLIAASGPIVATSANPSSVPPRQNMAWIKRVLPELDFYAEGTVKDTPSRLLKLEPDGSLTPLSR